MVETTLAIASLLTYVVAGTYTYVGLRLARQGRARDAAGRAMLFFGLWWLATALNQYLGSTLYLAAAFGYQSVDVQLAYVVLQRLLLAVSLVALMHYLLYLQTGRDYFGTLVAIYAAYWVLSVYSVVSRGPVGVESFGWRTDIVYANAAAPAWELLNLLIVLPPVIGALSLLRVYRRVEGRDRRLRIAMLSGGFVLWWVVAIVAGRPAAFDVSWLQAANRIIGITVALGILFAYQPTAWMRRRYDLERQALS